MEIPGPAVCASFGEHGIHWHLPHLISQAVWRLPQQARQLSAHRIYFRDSAFEEQGDQGAGLAMAFKLIEAAEARWRAVTRRIWSPSVGPEPCSRRATHRSTGRFVHYEGAA